MNRIFTLFLGVLPVIASAQQIYRWVDANGQAHFSQNPPPTGEYKNVTPEGTASPGPNPSYKPGTTFSDSSAADEKARQTALKSKADNAERCAKANERVSFLEEKTAHRLFKTGPDGEPARVTDEEFDQELNDAKTAASKYCQ